MPEESVKIALTKGYFAIVDASDAERVNQHSWSLRRRRNEYVYAVSTQIIDGKASSVLLHRFVLGAAKGFEVDHINGDGFDCRKCNLRLCTRLSNSYNRGPQKGGRFTSKIRTSKFKGVSWNEKLKAWHVTITASRKRAYLGIYYDEQEAARVYDVAAREMHGEFARLNFPGESQVQKRIRLWKAKDAIEFILSCLNESKADGYQQQEESSIHNIEDGGGVDFGIDEKGELQISIGKDCFKVSVRKTYRHPLSAKEGK